MNNILITVTAAGLAGSIGFLIGGLWAIGAVMKETLRSVNGKPEK